ncbi:ABC transporter substrate-binding protein [Mesorhizobium sp. 1B3]|uniref:ABC transporter substrate-binding protein n=1 Tax=Mesorhizobium sp. 1B3 TaxID=3243599 RepID=UPI003D974D7B
MTTINTHSISRRGVLRLAGIAGAGVLAMPSVLTGRAGASGTLTIRTLGGAYEEAARKVYFEPFTAETGITIQTVPANFSKLIAMHRSGNAEIDVIDIGETGVVQLRDEGAIEKIAYDGWDTTDASKLDKKAVSEFGVGHTYFATVLGYNSNAIAPEKAPGSWADFWNTEAFPGPRMLADIASGELNLEQALIADGVPVAELYPLDIPRALEAVARIRSSIRKFWDTGALSAQLLVDQEVVMGSIWNTRLQAAADAGAPLNIVWDGAMQQMQCWAISKGSKNIEGAQRFVEFAMAPERQAALAMLIPNGPTNSAAYRHITAERAKILPSNPEFASKLFLQNAQWWVENRAAASDAWTKWLLVNR